MTGRRVLAAVSGALVLTAVSASPAMADPAGPTNFESTVDRVVPATDAAHFEVTGGDAFLEVNVVPGHVVEIPGYSGEPYLRVDARGDVWLNEASPARFLNEDRYGESDVPEGVVAGVDPVWVQVGSGGSYAWHDHRVHWMSRDVPPAITGSRRQPVFPWEIRLEVDDVATVVHGDLEWVPPARSPAAPAAAVLALLGVVGTRRSRSAPLWWGIGASVVAIVVVVGQYLGSPVSARAAPTWLLFPALALAAFMAAATQRGFVGLGPRHLMVVGGLLLAAWAVSTVEVAWMPILPSLLPGWAERAAVGAVLAAGVGITAVAIPRILRDATP